MPKDDFIQGYGNIFLFPSLQMYQELRYQLYCL